MAANSSDVRTELGSPSSDVITDSTLEYIIENETTLERSAARAARIISRHFSLKADKTLGEVSYDYQDRAEKWLEIAKDFENKVSAGVKPYAGGISKSDKEAKANDPDMLDSFFTRDMFGGF